MAAGFEYFTHESVGAPPLRNTAGSFIAILDWALVGKGGWEKVFTGTNIAAYRATEGNRHYLRVDDSQTRHVRLRGYRAMTAISTGTNVFPATAQITSVNNWGVMKGGNATNHRYWGVRTNRYVIIVLETEPYAEGAFLYRNIFAFGEVPSYAESDSHNTILLGKSDTTSATGFQHEWEQLPGSATAVSNTSRAIAVSGNPSGSVTSPPTLISYVGAFSGSSAGNPDLGRAHFLPLMIANARVDGSRPYIRSALPNAHMSYDAIAFTPTGTTYPTHDLETFTVGGRSFIALTSYGYVQAGVTTGIDGIFLEITDTNGAL